MCSGNNALSLTGRITGLLGEAFWGVQVLPTQGQLPETGHRPQHRAGVPWGHPRAAVGVKGGAGGGRAQTSAPGKGRGASCRPRVREASQSLLPPSWARGWLRCEQCLLHPAILLDSYHPPDLLGLGYPLRSPRSWASAALWHTQLPCCGLTAALPCPPPSTATPIRAGTKSQNPGIPASEQT